MINVRICSVCGARLLTDNRVDAFVCSKCTLAPLAPAGQTGSMPAGEAAQAEVQKLAERVTVLEGRVDELCRALRAAQTAPAAAPPANKGYWR